MHHFLFISVLVLLSWLESYAQLAPERLAWNNLGKESWNKAEMQVRKALRKDSLNLGAIYTYAWFYFTPANPRYNIDSSSLLARRAQHYFSSLTKKDKEKNLRYPFDSIGLQKLRQYIDSTAYQRAKQLNNVEAYTFFIRNYSGSSQLNQAIELRQEVAFLDALKENTYQSFEAYIKSYPEASRTEEARKRYEKLLFDSKTKDQKLSSYIRYLEEYPKTPYRQQAEQLIFQLSTASGEINAFLDFFKNHPTNAYTRQARNFLYYFLRDEPEQLKSLLTDSLSKALSLEGQLWMPFWKNGTYGFLDSKGNEHLSNLTDTLEADIICDGFVKDILFTKNQLLSRAGHVLATAVEAVEDMGFGFLLVDQKTSGMQVLHKSGVVCLQQRAKLVGHHFFFSQHEGAQLYTLTGRKLLAGNWLEVLAFGDVMAFKDEQGYRLVTAHSLGLHINGQPLRYTDYFDEVKLLDDQYLWVTKGEQAALLDTNLHFVVPLAQQQIEKTAGEWVVKKDAQVIVLVNGKTEIVYDDLQVTENWKLSKRLGQYQLSNQHNAKQTLLDSAYLISFATIGFRNDSTLVFVGNKQHRFVAKPKVTTLANADVAYLLISEKDKKTIIDSKGEKLFSVQADNLSCVSADYFTYQKKDKRILLNKKGVVMPLVDFDAFGSATNLAVPLLHKKKFGLINRKNNKVIKPVFDRNLTAYNDRLVVAYKNGAYGFIDWDDQPLSKFEYDEVQYWNDSVALVKHSFAWRFVDLNNFNFRLGKMSEFTSFTNALNERYLIYKQDNAYGLLSNKRGVILEPTFTSIQNLGSSEQPFYMTDKFVEEAEVHIVIYYDQHGKQVRRQIYEEEEFARILCK
jgi:hypothetical protein